LYPDLNQLQRLHSHAWLALFDNHFDKNSIQAEARVYGAKCVALARAEMRDDPNDATAKRDLGSLASLVGALRMEASNSPNLSSTLADQHQNPPRR
jgi:hypothetical protein